MKQRSLFDESRARLAALALFDQYRSTLVDAAHDIAIDLAKQQGKVTSPQVLAVLREHPKLGDVTKSVDRRFMGAVFNRKCWERIGWTSTGSHRRPVSVWRYKP
jgi:hypothetical protein